MERGVAEKRDGRVDEHRVYGRTADAAPAPAAALSGLDEQTGPETSAAQGRALTARAQRVASGPRPATRSKKGRFKQMREEPAF